MGVVYRVYDAEMESDVALKILHQVGPEHLYDLKQEFRSLAPLAHRNLVELYELVVTDELSFFTMELVDGSGLLEHVRDGGRPCYDRLVPAFRQLVHGLAALHAAGKLHRDVKPSNLMVTREGRLVILDFGLAKALEPERARAEEQRALAGTLTYMAPEQMWGRALDPAADWYAAGVVLFEALAGRPPFEGTPVDVLHGKERGLPQPSGLPEGAPPPLVVLVEALLRPDPAERPGAEAVLALIGSVATVPGPRPPSPPEGRSVPFVGRAEELSRLRGLFDVVATGRPSIVHLHGTSGIGKSELLRRFATVAETECAAQVLRGRCHPQESVPFGALDSVVDDLSRLLASSPALLAEPPAPSQASALLRLFPVLGRIAVLRDAGGREEVLEPHELRLRGVHALRRLLDGIARAGCVVVSIDDAQWGDVDSALLLRELLRQPHAPSVLLLLSYRTEDRARSPLLRILADDDLEDVHVEELRLAPLGFEEGRALAAGLLTLSGEKPNGQAASIARESGGSPYFIGELVRHTRSSASEVANLSDVTADRVRDLSEIARRILEVVSVASSPIERSVVLRVAGTGAAGRTVVAMLHRRCLLRVATLEGDPRVEPYHDRIREAVVELLPAGTLAADHRALAEALEASPHVEPEVLARHFHGAGELDRAAHYAAQAAGRSVAALAFVRAADLYGLALEWRRQDDPEWTRDIQTRRAEALVNAGRSAEAARFFLHAARRAETPDGRMLRQRAAEQFLASGDLDAGVDVLAPLLREVGLRYPATPRRALLGTLASLTRLAAQGLDCRERQEGEVPPDELLRIDLCFSAAKGLGEADAWRGVHFSVQSLLLALRAGEPRRVGRGLAAVGGALMATAEESVFGRWGQRMVERARGIGARLDDPYVQGTTSVWTGQASMFAGRWREALERSDAGVATLGQRCRGVAFESNIGRMVGMRALEKLGRVDELRARAQELLAAAEAVGDRYAEVTASLYLAFCLLAAGHPEQARHRVERATARWSPGGFHIQHLYAARIEVYCDLYEQRYADAWRRMTGVWAPLKASYLLRFPMVRVDSYALRARTALALAVGAPRVRAHELLAVCAGDVKLLERERRLDARPHGLLLRAGIATARGDGGPAVPLLDQAIEAYDRLGMTLYAACARRRKGEALGRDRGAALLDEGDAVLRAQGIVSPGPWTAIHAPGFVASELTRASRAG